MNWLAQYYWYFILFGLLFVAMRLGHGGPGGYGSRPAPLERTSDEDDMRTTRGPRGSREPTGYQQ